METIVTFSFAVLVSRCVAAWLDLNTTLAQALATRVVARVLCRDHVVISGDVDAGACLSLGSIIAFRLALPHDVV